MRWKHFRQFGRQFLSTLRDVQFLIPTEDTLREVGSKEFDIPPRIQPGFIAGMLEEAIKRYGPDKKLILSNDERKVIWKFTEPARFLFTTYSSYGLKSTVY